jgi:hypothetical protein
MTDSPRPERPAAAPRTTPYELVFGEPRFEARDFPKILAEARDTGLDPLQADEFALIPAAASAVREVVPEEAPPESLEQYRALLYHAFNFWRFGTRVYLLDTPVARFLVEAAPRMSDWEVALPQPSVYVQLPANLFWGSISPEVTPEPVDGFFVTASSGEDALGQGFQRLDVLVVLGIRRDRAGFSVIPFHTEAGPGIAGAWAESPGRERGADFENVLPGGEIGGLYSLLTVSEALKLVGRALWYVDSFPGDLARVEPAEPDSGEGAAPPGPPVSRLPCWRVSLGRQRGRS